MGKCQSEINCETAHLSDARLEQLADARDAAIYARRKRQRARLEQELREVNLKISEYEKAAGTERITDAPAAAEHAWRVAQERCSAAGRAMRECKLASRGQQRAEREAVVMP